MKAHIHQPPPEPREDNRTAGQKRTDRANLLTLLAFAATVDSLDGNYQAARKECHEVFKNRED